MSKLVSLQQFLGSGIKQRFLGNETHNEMVANMQAVNSAMLDFYEQVCSYKHDLAVNL